MAMNSAALLANKNHDLRAANEKEKQAICSGTQDLLLRPATRRLTYVLNDHLLQPPSRALPYFMRTNPKALGTSLVQSVKVRSETMDYCQRKNDQHRFDVQ
ncbi:hypothetical protein V6Z92_000005 [Aspergillus fumigatus]